MARLTEYQKLVLDCLEDIFELYRRVEKGKEKFSSAANEIKQRLLDRISVSYGFEKGSYPVFTFQRNLLSLVSGKPHITYDPDEASTFIGIMKALRKATVKKEYHFYTVAFFDRVDAAFENLRIEGADRPKKSDITLYGQKSTKAMGYALRTAPPIAIVKRVPYSAIHSLRYGWISIWTTSVFGKFLLHSKPIEPEIIDIPKLTPRYWSSFTQIVRAILVNFHVAFGGYCRIKLCKTCGNLLVSHREEARDFCNANCRSKYSEEPKGKLSCRKRQNVWISYKILDPYCLTKDECKKCNLWHPRGKRLKGGKCQILRRNNKEAFDRIDKEMEEKIKKKEMKKKPQRL